MLVGNSSSGLFLIHAETIESGYVAARPFRVNAGPVHAYVYLPEGATKYLSDRIDVTPVRRAGAQGCPTERDRQVAHMAAPPSAAIRKRLMSWAGRNTGSGTGGQATYTAAMLTRRRRRGRTQRPRRRRPAAAEWILDYDPAGPGGAGQQLA